MSEAWTILKLIQWTTTYLKDKGIESSRLETEVLLAHLLQCKRIDLYVQFERLLSSVELNDYKALIKRRVQHEPLAYITGKKEFYQREFIVTKDVLIPRPETEMLIEEVKKSRVSSLESRIKDNDKSDLTRDPGPGTRDCRVSGLEIGLGSGCISISLLCEIPNLHMTAVEVSERAIEVAKKNAERHGVLDRLKVIQDNFLIRAGLEPAPTKYNFIVSNPPYVSTQEMQKLPESVRSFEPQLALEAGDDGLRFYPALVKLSQTSLKPNGFLAVEIGEDQGYRVATIFKEGGLVNVEVRRDFTGRERVVVGYKM